MGKDMRTLSKIKNQKYKFTSSYETATRRFDNIHVDIVGPLPKSQEKQYLFTIIDRFTRWPEAIPVMLRLLIIDNVVEFGVPQIVVGLDGLRSVSQRKTQLT